MAGHYAGMSFTTRVRVLDATATACTEEKLKYSDFITIRRSRRRRPRRWRHRPTMRRLSAAEVRVEEQNSSH